MSDLVNEFSWSSSRAGRFDECRRAYYLHYYASWGGWERDATDECRDLWHKKKLTNRWAWAGSAVHLMIAWALGQVADGGPLPSTEAVVDRMHERMRFEFRESRNKVWEQRRALGLVEHAYEEKIDAAEWKRNWEHARRCLETFFASDILREILSVPPAQWFPIDALDTFDLDGIRVFVAPDFAFRDGRGRVRILDWKTGRPRDKDHGQVQGYVLFAMDRWQVAPDDVVAELHYLATGEHEIVDIDPASLDAFRETLRASSRRMQDLLSDPARNIPKPRDAFPSVSDPAVCCFCNFRGACEDAVLEPRPPAVAAPSDHPSASGLLRS